MGWMGGTRGTSWGQCRRSSRPGSGTCTTSGCRPRPSLIPGTMSPPTPRLSHHPEARSKAGRVARSPTTSRYHCSPRRILGRLPHRDVALVRYLEGRADADADGAIGMTFSQAEEVGLARNSEVAMILVAGGLIEWLGYSGVKLEWDALFARSGGTAGGGDSPPGAAGRVQVSLQQVGRRYPLCAHDPVRGRDRRRGLAVGPGRCGPPCRRRGCCQ